jgi:hypothetical protein
VNSLHLKEKKQEQGIITNTLALPKDNMCPHTLNTKTIHSNLKSLNTFTKETGSPNVKLILLRQNFQKLDPM